MGEVKKYTLIVTLANYWSVGKLTCSDGRKWKINRFWSTDGEWFYIYGEDGSTGSGYWKGDLKQKIYIGDSEYEEKTE